MTRRRILITGATGFVGSRVAALLSTGDATGSSPAIRLLAHRRRPRLGPGVRTEVRSGSLDRPDSLRGICDGVDTVLHLASKIGGTLRTCAEVNDGGTAALLAEAERAGVRRVIQLGTTAVYRDGRHLCAREDELAVGPTTATSVTRLAGEERVLASGGLVLRPHLIYGDGDTWVVPALAEFLRVVPHWVAGGLARISVIGVADLARVIAALAVRDSLPVGEVLHASRPEPVRVRALMEATAAALDLPLPQGELTRAQAAERLGAARDATWRRRLSLLTVDHWYDSSHLWNLLGISPALDFAADFAESVPWYRASAGLSPRRAAAPGGVLTGQ
ncbi:NAD-dependent epimerase/dehydratase family protein [Streptomyces sp. NPDC058992]|uniref:NAD-dependent epimerase/dehydratase family protein n=1 Tax=unclassified Streptomyces TaxID=2593676 RepID=UPI0036BA33A1